MLRVTSLIPSILVKGRTDVLLVVLVMRGMKTLRRGNWV
jgi:hypothetical protein